MAIFVCVKQVVALDQPTVTIRPEGAWLDERNLAWKLCSWSHYALEEAIALKAMLNEELIAITVGPERARDVLRRCLARDVDRAIHVRDERVGFIDAMATAHLLAKLLKTENPHVVLTGLQAEDTADGVVGPALAGLLDLPSITSVIRTAWDDAAGQIVVRREIEGGEIQILRVAPPALLTVQTGGRPLTTPSLIAVRKSRNKEIRDVTLEELGFGADEIAAFSAGTHAELHTPPDSAHKVDMIEGPPQETAARLAERIARHLGRP